MYNEGISRAGGLLDVGTELEIVHKTGAFYSFGDTRLGQGRENAKEYLKRTPEMADEIEEQIRSAASGAIPIRLAVGASDVSDATSEEEEVSL
jgi:recombination protein RecA